MTAITMPGRSTVRVAIASQMVTGAPLTARELVVRLARVGLTVNRTAVNSVLYGDAEFHNDGSTPPRWTMAASAEGRAAAPLASRRRTEPDPATRRLRLYGWQDDALAAWRCQGERGVIEAVTGTGKTKVGIAAAIETVARGEQVCVLVPTRELLEQWVTKLRLELAAGTRIGRLGGGHRDTLSSTDVLVAIVNSARTTDVSATPGRGLLVADECHRYGSEVNQLALDDRFTRRLGLSATYARSDDGHLQWLDPYFGGTCFRMDYPMAIADEVTAHFTVALIGCRFSPAERVEYDEVNGLAAKTRHELINRFGVPAEPFGDFMAAVNDLAGEKQPGTVPARRYLRAFQRRKQLLAETPAKAQTLSCLTDAIRTSERTLVFTQTVIASEEASEQLQRHDIEAEAIHSRMTGDDRRCLLAEFGSGDLQVLVAPQVLDEGVDVPAADLAIIVAASRTRRQMIQRMGRVLRRKPDGRLARFAVLYVEGTSEDPDLDAHEDFLDEITGVADAIRRFPAGTDPKRICAFLNTIRPNGPAGQPRWAGEPTRTRSVRAS